MQKAQRVVFDVAVAEPTAWKTVLGNIVNLQAALGSENVEVAVVAYSRGLQLLFSQDPALRSKLKALADQGVAFLACRNSLRSLGLSETDLAPGTVTVDSGVAELVRKQGSGWSYLKLSGDPG